MRTNDIDDDDPISFDEAATIIFRGLITASTLRAAYQRGELEAERIGRRVLTTRRAVNAWRAERRVATRKCPEPSTYLEQRSVEELSGVTPKQLAQATLDQLRLEIDRKQPKEPRKR
jgi:hypothetical protein